MNEASLMPGYFPAYLRNPVFITGYNKSGTTLMLSLLDGHENLLVIPEELHYFRNVFFAKDRQSLLRKKTGFSRFLDEQEENWSQGKSWLKEGYPEFDSQQFKVLLDAIPLESNGVEFLNHCIDAFRRADELKADTLNSWVSKTTQNEYNYPLIKKIYGEGAKFIYVVRDPRDVFLSLKKREAILGAESSTDSLLHDFVQSWKVQVRFVQKFCKKNKNCRIVRYEDLVRKAEDVMREIASFVGIGWQENLLFPTRHGKQWGGNSVHAENIKGVSASPIGRYKKSLEQESVNFIGHHLGRELTEYGYDIDSVDSDKKNMVNKSFDFTFKSSMHFVRYHLKKTYFLSKYAMRMY